MKWVGYVVRIGERTGAGRVLVGGPEICRPFGIHSNRWEDNITVALQDTRLGVVDWMGLG
jgi:hypothetical protein